MNTKSVEEHISISTIGFKYNTRWFEADMVLQIEPLVIPLPPDMRYTISIDAGVLSSFNLPMEDKYEFTFTTRR